MKTKNEILHLLSIYKPTAESKYGLTRIGIFGSVARGEQTDDSDVDVCYEGKVHSLLDSLRKIRMAIRHRTT